MARLRFLSLVVGMSALACAADAESTTSGDTSTGNADTSSQTSSTADTNPGETDPEPETDTEAPTTSSGWADPDLPSAMDCVDALTQELDPKWVHCRAPSSRVTGLARLSDGSLVYGGDWTEPGLPGCGGSALWLHSYDAQGAERWLKDEECGFEFGENLTKLSATGGGGVIAVGVGGHFYNQAWIESFDAQGELTWGAWSNEEGVHDHWESAAIDGSGALLVTGWRAEGGPGDPPLGLPQQLHKYSPAGELLWERELGFGVEPEGRALEVVADESGRVALLGGLWVGQAQPIARAYDSFGDQQWEWLGEQGLSAQDLALGPGGELYLIATASGQVLHLFELDFDTGAELSEVIVPDLQGERAQLVLDSFGELHVLRGAGLAHIDPELGLLELRTFEGIYPSAVDLSVEGELVIAGSARIDDTNGYAVLAAFED